MNSFARADATPEHVASDRISLLPSAPARSAARAFTLSKRGIERGLLFVLTACGFIAFIEPSPYEYVFAVVFALFALSGGLRFSASIVPLAFCLMLFSLGGFISLLPYLDEDASVIFTLISAYMSVTTLFYAMLLRIDAQGRLDALRRGYILAAVIASVAGIVGYFDIGGLAESFARYDRAAGTFKDPNVLGTFVILPLVYLVRSLFVGKVKLLSLAALATILFGGVLLSFSRGAWGHAFASLGLMAILTYRASADSRVRRRIVVVTVAGIAFLAASLGVALSFASIAEMFENRASLEQSYDVGEQGRFGNQLNSIPMLMERPNGFGPLRFRFFFPEDPHNVYINAFASYGWLGGFSYLILIMFTLAIGWRVARARSPLQGHAIVIWSTLFVQILQGLQIDTDHWRHFWLMLGLIWGLFAALRAGAVGEASAPNLAE